MTSSEFRKKREALRAQAAARPEVPLVFVGVATCGLAAGARDVLAALGRELDSLGAKAEVVETGCIGLCEKEVLLDIQRPGEPRYTYGNVTPKMVGRIVTEHLGGGKPVAEWVIGTITDPDRPYAENVAFAKQRRIVLRRCGFINPDRIEDYILTDGYEVLARVVEDRGRPASWVHEEIKKSGLRGRGGAGFPTGLKWEAAARAPGDKKYIVCNADEGDPGAFMDRSTLEGDPHSVIEGMIIGAYSYGATEGYIYCRAEYPLAVKRLGRAIRQAEEWGFLGDNILGSGFSFHLKVKEGAGAFVCGEETALLASIEGQRGMPRPRPPFPARKGLWGCPTCINNVETLANVATIILRGASWFAAMGTEKSKGSKVFALAGKIVNTGLAEVPMGITLREIVYEIGGGILGGKEFKAVQIGGPSGGCLPASLLDTPVDYDSLTQAGAIMGSGGMIVVDESTCMVDLAKYFLTFVQAESCGKCPPCRVGTKRMHEVLERICDGRGREGDVELLQELGQRVKQLSLCGLGQTSPNPVLSTIRYFRHEYDAHIREGRCPAMSCAALLDYAVVAENCTGCTACQKVCPAGAVSGERKKPHVIDRETCIRCGSCVTACKFNAIIKTERRVRRDRSVAD
jgi:NADH-quinone oxidoreductase subunit F